MGPNGGMKARGIDAFTRERMYEQLRGFANFCFPKSRSFSFAHIVYLSACLKVHGTNTFMRRSWPVGRWVSIRRRLWCRTRVGAG